MIRWTIRLGMILIISACDPLLPLRVTSAVQPAASVELIVENGYSSLMSGRYVTLSARAFDAGSNVIDATKKTVTWSVSDPAMLTLSDGLEAGTKFATAAKAGSAVVTVTVDNKSAYVSLDVTPGPPRAVALISGGSQVTVAGDALPAPIVVEAHDAYGNVTPGATVQFSAPSGFFSTTLPTANSVGRASATYTPTVSGTINVSARIPGYTAITIPQTVTTLQIGVTTSPTTVRSGLTITPAPVVQLQYASNSAPYAKAGVIITASSTGATITGGSVATSTAGTATFSNLVATGTAGPITLLFGASAYGAVASAPTTLTGGLPTKLVVTTQPPASAIKDQPFSRAVVVQLQDAQSNASATQGVSIQATATGFVLTNNAIATDATGKATFTTLAVSGTIGQNFTLAFASPTLTGANVTARPLTGAATKLGISQLPAGAVCDATITTPPTVQLLDATNNPVSQSGVALTAAIGAGATIQAGSTTTTDVNGLATFSSLVVRASASVTFPLTFTSTGLTQIATTVTGASGAAVSLSVFTQPPVSATNGVVLTTSPAVRALDACANVATGSTSITVSVTTGSVTFTNPTRTTTAGLATFSSLSMAGKAQSYTLRFSATGLSSVDAATPLSLLTGAAAEVVLTTEPSTMVPSDVVLPSIPVARIRDVGGNQVVGSRTVTATIAASTPANGTTINAGSAATVAASDSTATFTGLKLKGIAGSYLLVFSSTGLKPDTALLSTALSGGNTATKMALTIQPSSGALNGTPFPRTPEVQLQDATGVAVALSGITVTVTQPGTSFSLLNGSVVTDATGKATFPLLLLNSPSPPVQPVTPLPLQFAASGLTSIASGNSTALATTLSTTGTAAAVSGTSGTNNYFGVNIGSGKTQLVFTFSGSQVGNANVYVNRTDLPTSSSTLCAEVPVSASVKTCTISNPTAGQYFVLVAGSGAFSTTTISALTTP